MDQAGVEGGRPAAVAQASSGAGLDRDGGKAVPPSSRMAHKPSSWAAPIVGSPHSQCQGLIKSIVGSEEVLGMQGRRMVRKKS